ncbi:MAG TPA: hypothetical protein VME18_02490 [Acidobacteriaceae bacterium]|nr:hypothetical protein [Acidobacteriaceae bacterium]
MSLQFHLAHEVPFRPLHGVKGGFRFFERRQRFAVLLLSVNDGRGEPIELFHILLRLQGTCSFSKNCSGALTGGYRLLVELLQAAEPMAMPIAFREEACRILGCGAFSEGAACDFVSPGERVHRSPHGFSFVAKPRLFLGRGLVIALSCGDAVLQNLSVTWHSISPLWFL